MPDAVDNPWELVHRSRPWGRYPAEIVVQQVSRVFLLPWRGASPLRALDLGCGGGANTWFLLREGCTVDALDGSATALERTRALAATAGAPADALTLHHRSLRDPFPWADGTFSVVLDVCAGCYVPYPDLVHVVHACGRVLARNGVYVGVFFGIEGMEIAQGDPGVTPNSRQGALQGAFAGQSFVQFLDRAQIANIAQALGRPARILEERLAAPVGTTGLHRWVVVSERG